ncbi:MAG: HAMP domain-containing sensor histidine kinase [Methanocalculus sp.]|nr:HAMP domain-containing sensor histidine kinase [Methanocalculus sp.]MDO9539253.1 HAMP domain-containing sensor histidine kinase [Methanocalculus sp.]
MQEIKQKSKFIMLATHELRTPLQPVIGYIDLLLSNPEKYHLSEKMIDMLKMCHTKVEYQREIIDRMLTISFVDSGNITIINETIHLFDFIEKIITSNDYRKDALVKNQIPKTVTIKGDARLTSHIFNTLIANAIQYNNLPRIVSVRHNTDSESDMISFDDNGRGIDISILDHIFEPFYITDLQQLNPQQIYMGLNLPIAQQYTQIQGGEITVDSTPGIGSIFTVRLPRRRGDT